MVGGEQGLIVSDRGSAEGVTYTGQLSEIITEKDQGELTAAPAAGVPLINPVGLIARPLGSVPRRVTEYGALPPLIGSW
jgi:hypothetical protein